MSRPPDRRPAFSAWNLNCADCGSHAATAGDVEGEKLRYIAHLHANRQDHIVNVWPRGRRDLTERIEPG